MAKKKNKKEEIEDTQPEIQEHSENTGVPHVKGMYQNWFLDYASYVILERAIPHINDGLKPVQRRILHSMWDMEDGRYNKVANIIGHSMKYHPHGDASIGDALVQLGQKDLLIDMQGNWGNIFTGDSAAAARYIEARLSKFALDVVFNPKTTEWQLSYDGRNREPVTLPVKFPLLLAQGVEGIAVGLSCKILPHNFNELIEASIDSLRGKKISLVPDFPTGGIADFSKYNEGLRGGRIRVRAKIEKQDRKTLVIREIPFGTTTSSLIDTILSANDKGKIKIKKVEDNTSAEVEIKILLHSDSYEDLDKTIDALYAFTDCEVSISPNACVIIDDKPSFMSVNDILKYNANYTMDLLKKELEIRKSELEEEWHLSSLVKIFIEKRIYRNIEECTTWESVIETIDTGLKPYKKKFKREITREDIVSLTEIKIKRISKYDVKEQDEKIKSIEEQLREVEHNLANLKAYAIAWFKELLKKYGKGKERRTEISSFEQVVASEVIINNQKLYVNKEDGFAGYGLKKDEFVCECSDLDDIIVFRGDGTMIVTKVDEKKYVGKDVRHIAVYRKNESGPVYNLIYQDGRGGKAMIKRFTVGGTTRDKEYSLTRGNEGSKILWLSFGDEKAAEKVRLHMRPKPKLRITHVDADFNEVEVKGRGAVGNIISRNAVSKVSLLAEARPAPETSQGKLIPDAEALPVKKEKVAEKVAVKAPDKKVIKEKAKASKGKSTVKSKKQGGKSAKKTEPPMEEEAVTMEWDFGNEKQKVKSDRNRIISDLEKKVKDQKKNQMKMDI
ncbi:MAG: DNA gyrase/topoisomerase IV subunit A [Bacteroidetes bacterium]|nr:MAG: DNA gyrase/topoisomerase IV subunit A [Bacteroidota bacterium]REJ99684.1 MAG: DNA gyrase/topoisomerase IV subunit A [Bacteroidota bacterium]REK33917.1 MAG: DNA gyrase/topoisomerase IV subunit A [Bacteroidota bacterium]REK47682.1 MAG: DNA gyrase/topoisomerase IV subunit A [Bacteroidota bacterium]